MKPTKVCKLCFKEITEISLNSLAKPELSLCDECYLKLNPKFKKFKIEDVDCLSIYEYNEDLKGIIYQYKGCFDFELNHIFLDRFVSEFRLLYSDFVIVPVPSFGEYDKIRGFNHVMEAFKILKIQIITCLIKNQKVKQSDRSAEDRKKISDYLTIDSDINLESKKVLLVDDIFTTGNTIRACLKLIKTLKPKLIKVLVLCKTPDLDNSKTSNINKLY